ncbi:MAG: pirin family protein [Bacteroidetes bacterium]|nr:pirin family protein [Bacteroidota bacterium]
MKTVIHPSHERGHANHGWLNAHHSFSFASWYHPDKIHFGALRVLNDDEIAAGMGFGTHPHDNMEIVTIPLSGAIAHKDSMGHSGIIKAGDVQIMSAGTGVHHSEFNASKTEVLNLFQIWVFPKVRNIVPRYEQKSFSPVGNENAFTTLVSPTKEGESLWINQDASFSMGTFDENTTVEYRIKHPGNGAFILVVEGAVSIENEILSQRDAIGVWETESVEIKINKKAKILVVEVPMIEAEF